MKPKIKQLIKYYWPTLIFGMSALISGITYPLNFLYSAVFTKSILGQILDIILVPLGWIGALATIAVFSLGDLTYKLWESLGLAFMGTGTKPPTLLGWLIYLAINIIIVFLLNFLAIKIIKSIKKRKSQSSEIQSIKK